MPKMITTNPANVAELLDVEKVLNDVYPQLRNTYLQEGNMKKAAKCQKEFEALQKKYNKARCWEECDIGTMPTGPALRNNIPLIAVGGKKNLSHAKLCNEAWKLAERWGYSQAYKAEPMGNFEYYVPLPRGEAPKMSFNAAPSSKWDFW